MSLPDSGFDDPARARSGRSQVMMAAGIVATAFVLSRLVGFGRDIVVGYLYGVQTLEVNAYTIANLLPETIFYVIAGGAVGSAFIPTFAGYFARDDEPGAWRLFAAVVNLLTLTVILVAGLTAAFAGPLIRLLYPDLITDNPALLPLAARLMQIMLLSTVIFGASGVVMGALNARQHFLMPAIAPIVYNLGIIAGALLWAPDVMGLALGTVLGAAGHLLVQLPALRRQGVRYHWGINLRDPGVRQVLRLMAPRVVGLSFGRVNQIVTQYLGQMMVLGSIRALDLGWRLMFVPISIIGQALGIAAFPTLSTLAAAGDVAALRRILADTLRLIFFLGLPISLGLMLLARPLVATLLQYGAFDASGTALVAWALIFYAVGLTALAAIEIIARAFYALEDTATPVMAGGLQILVMAGLGYGLSQYFFGPLGEFRLGGVALGASLANWLEMGLLLGLLRRKMGGVDGRHLWAGVWRIGLASLALAVAVLLVVSVLDEAAPPWQLLAGGLTGGMVYLGVSWLLGLDEWRLLLRAAHRRLRPGGRSRRREGADEGPG